MLVVGRVFDLLVGLHRPIIHELVLFNEQVVDKLDKQSRASLARIVISEGVVLNPSTVGQELVVLFAIEQVSYKGLLS